MEDNERVLSKEEIKELGNSTKNESKYALTTKDNPYNPFTQFTEWFLFDVEKGYNTCAYLDRIARTSNALSDLENEEELERAIDEIISYDFREIYVKIQNNFNNN